MSLFDYFYRLKVTEQNGVITVNGVRHLDRLLRAIERNVGTTRIGTYLFLYIGNTKLAFYSFHALDVIYLLNRFLNVGYREVGVPRKTIQSIIHAIEKDTWVADTFKRYASILNRERLKDFVYTPLPHQEDFFTHYSQIVQAHRLTGMLLHAYMGTGKTLMSLFVQRMLPIDTVIIVCPLPTLEDVWVNTLETAFTSKPTYWTSRMTTPFSSTVDYIIINYEYLGKMLDQRINQGRRYGIILDEGHNLTGKSIRTGSFYELTRKVSSKHTLWLTGTPIKGSSLEVFPIIRSIDPLFTPKIEERARKVFAGNNMAILEMLGSRLATYTKVIEKEALALDPPTEIPISVTLKNADDYTLPVIKQRITDFVKQKSQEYAKLRPKTVEEFTAILVEYERTLKSGSKPAFNAYKSDLAIVVRANGMLMGIPDIVIRVNRYEKTVLIPSLSKASRDKFKEIRGLYKYPSLVVVGQALGQVLLRARIDCFTDIAKVVDYIALTEQAITKTLVFTTHVESVIAAGKRCVEDGLKPITVYGSGSTNIPTAMKLIQPTTPYDPLIATYQSLGTGVPIIECNQIIFINQPYRSFILSQAISRVWRIGQPHPVKIFKVLLDTGEVPNLSTRNAQIMADIKDVLSALVGTDYLPDTLDDEGEVTDVNKHAFTSRVITLPSTLKEFAALIGFDIGD